jgi:VWFA-related protein
MKRAAVILIPFLLLAQETVFQSDVREVSVVFRAVDRTNQPVAGIAASDVRIEDDGVTRSITSFRGDIAHAQVVILVDVSGSMAAVFAPLQAALDNFADLVSQDYDREPGDVLLSLIAFSTSATVLVDRTSNTAEFKEAARRLRPSGTTALVDSLLATVENAFDSRPVARVRRPALAGGVGESGPLLSSTPSPAPAPAKSADETQRSKFLIIFTDAGENSSGHQWADIASTMMGREITVYSIAFDSGSPDSDFSMLTKIAAQSGGRLLHANAGQLQRVYAEIAHDIRTHYQLTFTATGITNPRLWRNLRVSVDRPGTTVFARAGYCPETPCQKTDGTFIGRRPASWNEVLSISRDPALLDSVRRHFRDLKFESTHESESVIRNLPSHPILVEKAWNAGKKPGASLVTRTGGGEVSMDSEVCGISAEKQPAAAASLTVADPEIRLSRRPGTSSVNNEESYFQSQAIFYLEDASGGTGEKIRVQCNRPNFLISDDLVQFAEQAVEQGLKLRLLQ